MKLNDPILRWRCVCNLIITCTSISSPLHARPSHLLLGGEEVYCLVRVSSFACMNTLSSHEAVLVGIELRKATSRAVQSHHQLRADPNRKSAMTRLVVSGQPSPEAVDRLCIAQVSKFEVGENGKDQLVRKTQVEVWLNQKSWLSICGMGSLRRWLSRRRQCPFSRVHDCKECCFRSRTKGSVAPADHPKKMRHWSGRRHSLSSIFLTAVQSPNDHLSSSLTSYLLSHVCSRKTRHEG